MLVRTSFFSLSLRSTENPTFDKTRTFRMCRERANTRKRRRKARQSVGRKEWACMCACAPALTINIGIGIGCVLRAPGTPFDIVVVIVHRSLFRYGYLDIYTLRYKNTSSWNISRPLHWYLWSSVTSAKCERKPNRPKNGKMLME